MPSALALTVGSPRLVSRRDAAHGRPRPIGYERFLDLGGGMQDVLWARLRARKRAHQLRRTSDRSIRASAVQRAPLLGLTQAQGDARWTHRFSSMSPAPGSEP